MNKADRHVAQHGAACLSIVNHHQEIGMACDGLRYVRMTTEDDVRSIIGPFHEIFWEEPNYDGKDFFDSVNGTSEFPFIEYFKVMLGEDCIGFCGLYSENSDEVWLGWFGVRPAFRRRGYARQMLRMLVDRSRAMGYRFVRVYTDKVIDNNAYRMYLGEGFEEDSTCGYDFVTMVKSLTGEVPAKWSGTPCGFESEPPHHFQ